MIFWTSKVCLANGLEIYIIDFGVYDVLISAISLVIEHLGKTFSYILVNECEVITGPSSAISSHYAKSIFLW